MKNIQFNYLYRDAGNYKSWGEVVFSNPDKLPLNEVENRLKKACDLDGLFIADQININELFFEEVTEDDHCYHEFYSVEFTDKDVSDSLNRSISTFVEQVELESKKGWRVFDPELLSCFPSSRREYLKQSLYG